MNPDDRLQILLAYRKVAAARPSFLSRLWNSLVDRNNAATPDVDLAKPILPLAQPCARIMAIAEGDGLRRDRLAVAMVELSLQMCIGSRLVARIASDDGTYDSRLHPIAGDLQTAMLAAGLYLERLELDSDKVVGHGRKVIDWSLVSGIQDDHAFIRAMYEQVLCREADAAGMDNYLDELRDGADRQDLLKVFLSSDERWALAERHYPDQLYQRG